MDDFPEKPLDAQSAPLQSVGSSNLQASLQVDPKLLTKALNKMRGLVKGNGLDTDKVVLLEDLDNTFIQMYRFKARTTLQLTPQYGIKVEPGRNTAMELMPSEAEFRKAIAEIAIDARTNSQKRNQIVDYIMSRPDKGFGMKDQKTKFHFLSRDFVQHEKCTPCANSGRLICTKCHGKKMILCTKCHGRRQMPCPRCKGATRIQTNKGMVPCQFCRGDGKVNCSLCGARGQIKCQNCAASGTIGCRICAGTGWLSHLAHVEIYARISFDFEKNKLPSLLVQSIESNASRCIERHEIEVSPLGSMTVSPHTEKPPEHQEPDDTIWIDYDAICPFGSIAFEVDGQKIAGQLFGFQTRLLEFPFFLDVMTRLGQTALLKSSMNGRTTYHYLKKAGEYRLLRDIMTQTLFIKNAVKAKLFLREKHMTGVNPETIDKLVDATDLAMRHITRKWRIIGMIIGLIFYTLSVEYYYLGGGRLLLKNAGVADSHIIPLDVALVIWGIAAGVLAGKYMAKWSQDKALEKIVPVDFLKRILPRAGKTFYWCVAISIIIPVITIIFAQLNDYPVPDWFTFLLLQSGATTL